MNEKRAKDIMENVAKAYDAIASGFSETRGTVWGEFNPIHSYVKDGHRVLDAGCGNGRFLKFLSNKKIQYVGYDNSAKLLEKAQALAATLPGVDARFDQGDLLKLPYEPESFDVILSIAALHHLPSHAFRVKAVQELYRVLKSSGLLIMSNWFFLGSVNPLMKQLLQRLRYPWLYRGCSLRDFFIPWHMHKENKIYYRYYYAFTKKEMERLLSTSGFSVYESYISTSEPDWSGKRHKRNIIALCRKN